MAKDEQDKIRHIAEASILLLISRISGPALLGVCSYIAISVVNLKTDLSSLAAGMNATIAGVQRDLDNLQEWRNTFGNRDDSESGNHHL